MSVQNPVAPSAAQGAAATADLAVVSHYINGQAVEGTSGRFGDVSNPALGQVARRVAFASKAEVDSAIAAAFTLVSLVRSYMLRRLFEWMGTLNSSRPFIREP